MAKIEIQLPTGYLDISKEFPLPLVYSIDDIRKVDKKNSAYSKTITLPGTKNNNILLGNLFDVNQDFSIFNPNFKTPAKVVLDSTTIIEGFMKLNDIEVLRSDDLQGNLIQYKVSISSEETNFFTDIKDKLLSDLNFDGYSHEFKFDNIKNSWNNTADDVYVYPMMKKITTSNYWYETADWAPAIFHKAYLKRIAIESGYELGGTFMDDTTETGSRYAKEIITYNGGRPVITQTEIDRRKWRAGLTSDEEVDTYNFSQTVQSSLSIFNRTKLISVIDDKSNLPNFDNGNHFNLTTNTWSIDSNGVYDISGNIAGTIDFSTSEEAWAYNWDSNFGYASRGYGAGNTVNVFIGIYNNNVLIQEKPIGGAAFPTNSGYQYSQVPTIAAFNSDNSFSKSVDFNKSFTLYNIPLTKNSNITYKIRYQSYSAGNKKTEYLDYKYLQPPNSNSSLVAVNIKLNLTGSNATYLWNGPHGGNVTDGDVISLQSYIPANIKQSTIITDIIKRFNLYIQVDPTNKKKLLLNTRNDYYESGTTLDWTDKKDFSTADKVQLLSELQTKEMLFTYTAGKDDTNKDYTSRVGNKEIYGQKKIAFDNQFVKGIKTIKTPFTPSPLAFDVAPGTNVGTGTPGPRMVIPQIDSREPKNEPRVLYYGGLIDNINGNGWSFGYLDDLGISQTHWRSNYPYCGHYDNPFTPEYSIGFGPPAFEDYNVLENTTDNNLYNLHWSSYVNQINQGRLVTSKFLLTERDISFIKDNLNTKIFIKDSYYTINKISYNPVGNNLTSVELLKIVEGVKFKGTTSKFTGNPADGEVVGLGPVDGGGLAGEGTGTSGGTSVVIGGENTTKSDTVVNGSGNYVSSGVESTMIMGNDNLIEGDVSKSGILGGDNNKISTDVSNSWIIAASNKTITEDNEIWIGELHIVNGKVSSSINRIVGGVDELRNLYPNNLENRIVGGVDEIRRIDNTNIINRIVGGIDSL